MTGQDVAALVVCGLALAWLVRRVFLSHGPPARRPDVTTRALLKRTRARHAENTAGPPPPHLSPDGAPSPAGDPGSDEGRGGHDCH